jgi:hypothetical protein
MSSTYAEPLDLVERGLDELAAIDPGYRTIGEKQELLLGLARVRARVAAEELRVLAVAEDIAEATGDRSTATWLANQTREAHGTVGRHAVLASALDSRWTQTAAALGTGDLNLAQARVIVEALETLPKGLGDDLRVKAEAYLVEQAHKFGPRELRHLGRSVLEHLAPEIADEHDYQRLLAEEAAASAATKLTMRRRGDGSTDINARVPDHAAGRLCAYLNAYTAPRRRHLDQRTIDTPFGPLTPPTDPPTDDDEADQLPIARRRGQAFVALLENIPTDSLPRHGGTATTVTITLDYHTLITAVGTATTSTGQTITAGQARRLACQAGIVPVVLDGHSEILDVGRTRRLVTDAIRKALNLRDQGCTTIGCSMPAEFCEAHHIVPWSRGGKTSLAHCKLLCPFHHHRAHDPTWQTHHHANGTTTFHRRT